MSHPVSYVHTISLVAVSISLLAFGGFVYVASTDAPTWERTERVFVYGTLTNPAVRFVVCRCHTPLVPTTLDGYQKDGLTILPDQAAAVSGGVIAVSPIELARLDRYERVPTRYRREAVNIRGQSMWVYIKN